MEGVHKNIKYTCEQCEDKATTKGILRVHFNTVHDKVNYLNVNCGFAKKQPNLVSKLGISLQ